MKQIRGARDTEKAPSKNNCHEIECSGTINFLIDVMRVKAVHLTSKEASSVTDRTLGMAASSWYRSGLSADLCMAVVAPGLAIKATASAPGTAT
eukprot:scaffold180462_cov22-Prasinocladus_malaysianus.AAC.1